MVSRRTVVVLVTLAIVLAFADFVWPTPYEYHTVGSNRALVRVHRVSGLTQILTRQGWRPAVPDSVQPLTTSADSARMADSMKAAAQRKAP